MSDEPRRRAALGVRSRSKAGARVVSADVTRALRPKRERAREHRELLLGHERSSGRERPPSNEQVSPMRHVGEMPSTSPAGPSAWTANTASALCTAIDVSKPPQGAVANGGRQRGGGRARQHPPAADARRAVPARIHDRLAVGLRPDRDRRRGCRGGGPGKAEGAVDLNRRRKPAIEHDLPRRVELAEIGIFAPAHERVAVGQRLGVSRLPDSSCGVRT